MDLDRTRRLSTLFTAGPGTPADASLCTTCVEILDVVGAGISIMSGRNSGPVCSSSDRVRRLEDLQFSLGEGPCHDAYLTGEIVSEPDLASRPNRDWPSYTPPALDLGACAVFAFPLRTGVGTVGVLTLYQDTVGMLTGEQDADGRALAQMLPGLLAAIQERGHGTHLSDELSDADAHRDEVHQACGITAVQIGINANDALLRIRAYAYATSQTVAEISQQIIAHRLYLGDDGADQAGALK